MMIVPDDVGANAQLQQPPPFVVEVAAAPTTAGSFASAKTSTSLMSNLNRYVVDEQPASVSSSPHLTLLSLKERYVPTEEEIQAKKVRRLVSCYSFIMCRAVAMRASDAQLPDSTVQYCSARKQLQLPVLGSTERVSLLRLSHPLYVSETKFNSQPSYFHLNSPIFTTTTTTREKTYANLMNEMNKLNVDHVQPVVLGRRVRRAPPRNHLLLRSQVLDQVSEVE